MIGLLVTVSANQLSKSMERCLEKLTVAQLLTKFFAFCELFKVCNAELATGSHVHLIIIIIIIIIIIESIVPSRNICCL